MRAFSRTDFLDAPSFLACRLEKQKEIIALKEKRRVAIGPFAMVYFENFQTLWWQIQEMLRIEQGGEAQLEDELSAYGPLLPQGSDFRATVMFEIPDPVTRLSTLKRLGAVEKTIQMHLGAGCIQALPLDPEETRITEDGKTSAIHFVRFPLSVSQKAPFLKTPLPSIVLEITHPHYSFRTALPERVIQELQKDLFEPELLAHKGHSPHE